MKWEHFISKLGPGQKETWTAVITGPGRQAGRGRNGRRRCTTRRWTPTCRTSGRPGSTCSAQDYSRLQAPVRELVQPFQHLHGNWPVGSARTRSITYRSFPADIVANLWGYAYFGRNRAGWHVAEPAWSKPPMATPWRRWMQLRGAADGRRMGWPSDKDAHRSELRALRPRGRRKPQRRPALRDEGPRGPRPDLSKVTAAQEPERDRLLLPALLADADGVVKIEFTMPEALTEWKFLGFAHDRDLRSGFLQDKAVTAKDLMVEPNPPRFLREGDALEFTVKVTNQSPTRQTGQVRLTPGRRPHRSRPVDAELGNTAAEQAFDIPAKESRSFAWRLTVPDGLELPDVQGRRLDRPAVRRRGRLPAGALAADPGDRIAAAADPRAADQEVRLHQAAANPASPTRCSTRA